MKIFMFENYIAPEQLPLKVEFTQAGKHSAMAFHAHDFSEVAIVLSGTAVHVIDDMRCPIASGDVLVVHPGIVHAYDCTETLWLVNVLYKSHQLPLPRLDSYTLPLFHRFFPDKTEPVSGNDILRPVLRVEPQNLTDIHGLLNKLYDETTARRPGAFFGALGLFMELLLMLARLGPDAIKIQQSIFRLGAVLDFVGCNYPRKITIEELVVISRMSRSVFFASFQNATGCSPQEYLLNLRIHHAVELLQNSDQSISNIAFSCGFFDSNYFCRKFRQVMKVSPSRFRKS